MAIIPVQPILKGVKKAARDARVKRPGEELLEEPKPKETPRDPELEATREEPVIRESEEPVTIEDPPVTPDEPTPARPEPELSESQKRLRALALDEADIPDVPTEAARLSQARLGDFSLDESFQTNFDTITTTDEVKSVIADVAQQNAGRIDEARRGVITNNQLRELSADLDLDEDVVRAVMERESGGILNAETILAARQVLNSSADRVSQLARKITRGEATDIERLQFRRQLQFHREYQVQFMGARAEAGRALNAFRIPTGADIDVSRVRELVDSAHGYDTDRIAAAVSLMDNPTAISKAARKYTQSKLMGTINELFINSILSGPKTHLINTGGNLLMQTMAVAETAVAARLGRFLPGEDHVRIGEASALMHGTLSAWKDGFRLAAKSMRSGTALDDVVKFEGTRRRSTSAEHLLTPEQANSPLGRFASGLLDGVRIGGRTTFAKIGADAPMSNTLRQNLREFGAPIPGAGQLIRSPTERVMIPVDEFFKTLAYRGEISRQAYRHAYDQVSSGAIKADQAEQIAREFMEDAPLTAKQAAEDYARYVTFQNQLGPAGQKFQNALRSVPALSLLAPFVRTPVNLFVGGILDRSPVGIFRKKFFETMKAGGPERDMMLARVTMGSATTAIIASYAMDGTITGAGPSNPEARAILEAANWQPYSIRIEDPFTGKVHYQSYARAEPLAFVIGATADAVEVLSYVNSDVEGLEDERQQINDAVAAIIIGVANNTMSKTYVKGIADFTEMMTDPKRYFPGWSRGMATAMVPFSSLRRQLGQIDDPYLREAWTTMDALKVNSGIPGWSGSAPPRRDFFGQRRPVYAGSLLGPMSPMPDREENADDPVINELVVLMEQTREVPVTMPGKSIEGMRLNAVEYDSLVTLARDTPAPNGRTFKEEMARVIQLPTYVNATPFMQVELLKDVQESYDDQGRRLLEKEDPVFAAKIADYRQRRRRLRFGE